MFQVNYVNEYKVFLVKYDNDATYIIFNRSNEH